MIKINLLPFRAAKKRENIRRQVSVYFLTLIFALAVMGYLFLHLNSKVAALESERVRLKSELTKYEKTNKKIKEIKQKIKEAREKLAVIKELEKNKQGPVRLLDEISSAVPEDKLWLDSLSEKKGILTLEGSAMDNKTVALFMTNLEKSGHIKSVDLKSTKSKNFPEFKIDLTEFVISCKTYLHKEPEPETKGKKGKKKAKGKK